MKPNNFFSIVVFLIYLILNFKLQAEESFLIKGIVVDLQAGTAIPGATVRIINTNNGTYTSASGKFRLPLEAGTHQLKISSIGYKAKYIQINKAEDSLRIELEPLPVAKKEVKVVADIDVEQIIKRAIERKKENLDKIKTLKGLLYTKMVLEFGGDAFEKDVKGSGSGINIGIGPKKASKAAKMMLTETFSNVYNDYEKDVAHTEILQRRQTANLPSQYNLVALGTYMNFYEDNIQLLTAKFTGPLAEDALDYYKFRLLERLPLDDRFVYILELEPKTDTYPLFRGIIKIIEGTYNLIELEIKPNRNDAIPLIDSIVFTQKFTEVEKDIWYPDFLEVTGKARVDVIKGFMTVLADIKITNILNEVDVNILLPDSIYQKEIKMISVVNTADSVKTEFWENNSLRDISPHELDIYHEIDSLVTLRDSLKKEASNFSYDILPLPRFERVSSIALGLIVWTRYNIQSGLNPRIITLETAGKYSFGLYRWLGSEELTVPLIVSQPFSFSLFGGIHSLTYEFENAVSYPGLTNTLSSALIHRDYNDYYHRDGWSAGFSSNIFDISLNARMDNSRQFSEKKTTNQSIFSKSEWRENPSITEGNYLTLLAEMDIPITRMLSFRFFDLNLKSKLLFGRREEGDTDFKSSLIEMELTVPTFSTGYNPMEIKSLLQFGIGTSSLPVQYQFRTPSTLILFSKFGSFYSAPVGVYGGTEYYSVHIEYNLTDLWWRAIGLPTYEGRGIDIILAASFFKVLSTSPTCYTQTVKNVYAEAGFGLARIPTFISNVFFLSFNARWGLGPIAKNRFGWGIGADLPF